MMADPQQKAKLVDKFSKEQGISKPEAEKKLDQAGRTLEVVKKKELDPNAALTPQEQTDYDRRNDPTLAPAITFLEKEERNRQLEQDHDAKETCIYSTKADGRISSFVPTQHVSDTEPAIKTSVSLDGDFKKASKAEPPAEEPEAKVAPVIAATPTASAKAAGASWG
jgi:hypothetical protein